MKFIQRVVFLALSAIVFSIIFVIKMEQQLSFMEDHLRIWDFKEEVRKTVVGQVKECQFAEKVTKNAGIHTFDLYDEIGKQVNHPVVDKDPHEKVTVFLMPHSHTDPGWLMSVDEYYKELTKNILDNMVIKMKQYEDVKFVWGETVFLAMWWRDISDAEKDSFKELVQSGRVEIINGGWVAPDEAITLYYAMIDQLILGHQWVQRHLGVKPKVGWSPDPFGYSSTMPYLLNRAGVDDTVILRIHRGLKYRLRSDRNVEVHWRQSWDLQSNDSEIFCHIMPYALYNFKYTCGPNPDICNRFDFRNVPGKNGDNYPPSLGKDNIEEYGTMLANAFRQKSQVFRHNVIFHAMGDDFRYDTALEWDEQIRNYTMLRDYINGQKDFNMEVKYGTLTDYFSAVKYSKASNKLLGSFPVLHGDFFPYLDFRDSYWTGFYTTRPFYKQLGREIEGNLRTAEVLHSLAIGYRSTYGKIYHSVTSNMKLLQEARQHLAIFQHHDAISGTSKPRTVKDYERRLWEAKRLTRIISSTAATYLFSSGKSEGTNIDPEGRISYDLYPDDGRSNETPLRKKKPIHIGESGVNVAIFNPVPKIRHELIRLVVDRSDVTVYEMNNQPLMSQIHPIWLKQTLISSAVCELMFYTTLPPMGMVAFVIKPGLNNKFTKKANIFCRKNSKEECGISPGSIFTIQTSSNTNVTEIENNYLQARFDEKGALSRVTLKGFYKDLAIKPMFMKYASKGSGAYIFRPSSSGEYLFHQPRTTLHIEGALFSQVRMTHEILVHSVGVYHTSTSRGAALEVENILDMAETVTDTEIFMRFVTSMKNKEILYTDSNGYQMVKRKRRDEFGIAGNFFPMASMCYLQDFWLRFSVLAGQPHGVASLEEGVLDVMLDRKLFGDDYRGLEEGVTDNRKTRSTFHLLLEPNLKEYAADDNDTLSYPSLVGQQLIDELLRPVTAFVMPKNFEISPVFSPLHLPLSCDLDLVNLRAIMGKYGLEIVMILHRRGFQCYFDSLDVNCPLSNGVIIPNSIFRNIKIRQMTQVSLSLMYDKGERNLHEKLHIKHMEIATFRMDFV